MALTSLLWPIPPLLPLCLVMDSELTSPELADDGYNLQLILSLQRPNFMWPEVCYNEAFHFSVGVQSLNFPLNQKCSSRAKIFV